MKRQDSLKSDALLNLLGSSDETYIKNPVNDTYVYISKDVNLWLDASAKSGLRLVSPGGAASACGVSRMVVYNWYMRDRKLTTFMCAGRDKFVLVDFDGAIALAKSMHAEGSKKISD